MYKEFYNMGYDAYSCGDSRESNPFEPGSVAYVYWLDGYDDAEYDLNINYYDDYGFSSRKK